MFRKMDKPAQAAIRARGGMGEWLMSESCKQLQPCEAIYAYIGDAKSLAVNTRVGFRLARGPYLYVLASRTGTQESVDHLTEKVAAIGAF